MNGSSAAAIPSRGGQVDSDLIVVSLGVLYQKVLEIVGEYELSPQVEFYLLFCVQTSKLLPLLCDFNDLFEPKLEKIWQEWMDEKQKISMQMNGIDLRQQGQDSHSEQALLQFRSAIAMSIVLEKTFGSAKKSFSTISCVNMSPPHRHKSSSLVILQHKSPSSGSYAWQVWARIVVVFR